MSESDTRPPSEPPPGEEEGDPAHRRRLEKILRETIRRALERGLETGLETISRTDEALRGVVGDVKLPREIVGYVFSQLEDTKNLVVRIISREVRDFLEATDLAAELRRALTSLSFEIKTEIRFVPTDNGNKVRPSVHSVSRPRRSKPPPEGEEPEEE